MQGAGVQHFTTVPPTTQQKAEEDKKRQARMESMLQNTQTMVTTVIIDMSFQQSFCHHQCVSMEFLMSMMPFLSHHALSSGLSSLSLATDNVTINGGNFYEFLTFS